MIEPRSMSERDYLTGNLENKVILVTGGTGLVGSHLTRTLVDGGASVVVLARAKKSFDGALAEKVKFVQADVARPLDIRLESIDWVFHLAAVTDLVYCRENPEIAFKINTHGVRNVLELSESARAERFVYLSTLGVYGIPRYLPIDEHHPTLPIEPYAQSKLCGEEMSLSFISRRGMSISVARSFNAYGPGQNSNMVVPTIILQMLRNDNIELENLEVTRDFVYVSDIVAGLIRIALQGCDREIYNLGSGVETSIGQLVNEISELLDRRVTVNLKSKEVLRVPRSWADISKARRQLGWAPSASLREGLARTIRFYQDRRE